MRRNRFSFFLVATLLFASCEGKKEEITTTKPQIVVTTTLLADAISNLVKDSAQVVSIMGPGVDPHLYKASIGDLRKFMDADRIFYQGLHLEGKLAEVLQKLGRTKPVTGLADRLPKNLVALPPGGGDFPDPHIWFDVRLWKEVVGIARDVLLEEYPEWESYLKQNAADYMAQLDRLDREVREQVQRIPSGQRLLITAHDAFGYFGRAYGIEVKGLQGISTQAEFGLRDVSDLVKLIVERDIKAVFVEKSVSDKALRAVVEGAKEKDHSVKIGGSLYTDALGASTSEQGTYIGMVRYNVSTIVNALK